MVDWSPFGGDPVPGEPARVTVLARAFHSFADDVDGQNALLKALKADSTGVWEGPAADAFRPHLEDLPPKLDKLVRSYREAGDALSTYAPKLQVAQDEAIAALRKATEAMTRLGTAQSHKNAQDAANRTAAADATPDHPAPTVVQPDYGAAVTQAQADLAAAHRAKDAAVDDARTAARHCIDALRQAADDGIKNKHHHWWDTVTDVLTHPVKLLKVISQVANTLSAICGILTLVTCWIPGVGEAFAAAALITGAIGLVADALLAATGNGSWSQVALDGLNVIPGGLGRDATVAADLGKGAVAAEDGARAARAVDRGSTALHDAADAAPGGSNFMAPGEQFAVNAAKAKPEPGFHDVVVHGSPKDFGATPDAWRTGDNYDHRVLSNLVSRDPAYPGGDIRLLSCSTGAPGATAAQNLANRMGVTVMAPTDTLWAFGNGRLTIGKIPGRDTGSWEKFLPGGPR